MYSPLKVTAALCKQKEAGEWKTLNSCYTQIVYSDKSKHTGQDGELWGCAYSILSTKLLYTQDIVLCSRQHAVKGRNVVCWCP